MNADAAFVSRVWRVFGARAASREHVHDVTGLRKSSRDLLAVIADAAQRGRILTGQNRPGDAAGLVGPVQHALGTLGAPGSINAGGENLPRKGHRARCSSRSMSG